MSKILTNTLWFNYHESIMTDYQFHSVLILNNNIHICKRLGEGQSRSPHGIIEIMSYNNAFVKVIERDKNKKYSFFIILTSWCIAIANSKIKIVFYFIKSDIISRMMDETYIFLVWMDETYIFLVWMNIFGYIWNIQKWNIATFMFTSQYFMVICINISTFIWYITQ